MNVEAIGKNRLRFYLSDRETTLLFGGYENINYTNSRTREALNKLLRCAECPQEFVLDCPQLSIEVRPCTGGCMIQFTKQEIARRFYRAKRPILFIFHSANALLDACFAYREFAGNDFSPKSRLYHGEKSEWLLLIEEGLSQQHLNLFRRYRDDEICHPHLIGLAEEYGKLVCEKEVIRKIADAMKKKL